VAAVLQEAESTASFGVKHAAGTRAVATLRSWGPSNQTRTTAAYALAASDTACVVALSLAEHALFLQAKVLDDAVRLLALESEVLSSLGDMVFGVQARSEVFERSEPDVLRRAVWVPSDAWIVYLARLVADLGAASTPLGMVCAAGQGWCINILRDVVGKARESTGGRSLHADVRLVSAFEKLASARLDLMSRQAAAHCASKAAEATEAPEEGR